MGAFAEVVAAPLVSPTRVVAVELPELLVFFFVAAPTTTRIMERATMAPTTRGIGLLYRGLFGVTSPPIGDEAGADSGLYRSSSLALIDR